jgi:hypothetical protein
MNASRNLSANVQDGWISFNEDIRSYLCKDIIQNIMFLHNFCKKKVSIVINHYNCYPTIITFYNFHTKKILSLLKTEISK